MEKRRKVCVTGAAGYLCSHLVKKLLERGYIVRATTRNLGDTSKVGLLKGLPNRGETEPTDCTALLPNAETKIIYTASAVAASPMKEDGTGFKDSMNESCWTPFNLSFPYSNEIVTVIFLISSLFNEHMSSYKTTNY
uniref:NAD-dependent epimerase/dehydratase domain-containing protein n=1 Tax=Manihot esculenta TaxID=3983 RepID=A0A2C9VSV0_MANES